MPIKYVPFFPDTVEGQAILNNFVRTRRALNYKDNDGVYRTLQRGMPYFELEKVESVGNNPKNMLIRGECISACAYLREKGIKVDLVYIDPPFASGADYAKKIYVRRNPKVAKAIKKAEEELEIEDIKAFEEKMYGDIWNKEAYLNWMYENILAIRNVMSSPGLIYVHLDYHIGHYIKILLDEIFGESNFRNEIVVKRIKKNIREREHINSLNNATDMILFYAIDENVKILPPSREEEKDERWHSFEAAGFRTGMDYNLFNFHPSPSNHWRWELPKTERAIKNYEKWKEECSSTETLTDYWKRTGEDLDFLRPHKKTGKPEYFIPESVETLCDSMWDDIPAYSFRNDYSTEKSDDLLARIIDTTISKFKNELTKERMVVADFFGGSGVTAAVANDLDRNFIHVDVGINSIQTTRDRLRAANAEFDIYEIKDGVNLFRNPTQTMDKLSKLIPGMQRNTKGLSKYWFGKLNDSKLGMIPVYLPDLRDHTQRVFDKPIANQLVNQELGELENVKKVVVYYIDLEDKKEIEQFIKEQNNTEIEVELRDLKQVLSETVIDDIIEYKAKEEKVGYCIEIKKIISDRLLQKIDEYNQKGLAQPTKQDDEQEEENGNGNGNGNGENGEAEKKKKKFSPIKISKGGLELIELVSLDCTNRDGIWKSDKEIKIDKLGYVIEDGQKTKNFWDAKIRCEKKPLRMKVRNIAGDEIIIEKVKLQ